VADSLLSLTSMEVLTISRSSHNLELSHRFRTADIRVVWN
jgi:hypothetical protein